MKGHRVRTESIGWTVTTTHNDFKRLHRHLLQGDGREHAAFLLAGLAQTDRGTRLLVKEVLPVPDKDFQAGESSYVLGSRAVARASQKARSARLCLLWAHSHPGAGAHVDFSSQDHRTMVRAHPAMLDIVGAPVGALVLGENSVAGELWSPGATPISLTHLRVLGPSVSDIGDGSRSTPEMSTARHARQILLFGQAGQARLRDLRVAVLGVGGGGSIIVEQLARIGVGEIWGFDNDTVALSNLSRIVGSTKRDARVRRAKVRVAQKHIRSIDSSVKFRAVKENVDSASTALDLAGVDAIFVATDTALGRYAANALAYQYLIPVFQVGAKVQADIEGRIETIHTAARIAMPGYPCLQCQGAIPAGRLRLEQAGELERRAQDYLGGGEDIPDPSVISLNSIPVGTAVTDFMLMFCGLLRDEADLSTRIWHPLDRRSARRPARTTPGCSWCDPGGSATCFARGDSWPLPLPKRTET